MGRGILLGGVPAWPQPTSRFWEVAWWAPRGPHRRAASRPTWPSWMSTWIGCDTWTTSCRPMSTFLFSDRHTIREQLRLADLVIGSVLIRGAKAHLATRSDLQLMKPGSVIIDVAIDQGGCFETSRPTTHKTRPPIVDDVLHYCVTNMPGAVGRTSTFARKCHPAMVIKLVTHGIEPAIRHLPRSVGRQYRGPSSDQPGSGRDVCPGVPSARSRLTGRDTPSVNRQKQPSERCRIGARESARQPARWIPSAGGCLQLLDQTLLPAEIKLLDCAT